jgi:hypothetical protein
MSEHRLLRAAQEILSCLDTAGIPACLIGALAVHRWGEPRATRDVDFSVLAPYGAEAPILDLLLDRFATRQPDARAFALANRVLLLRTVAGPDADIALAAFPFEIEALDQSSPWEAAPGIHLRTCSAEHLIVYKLVAGRPHDIGDIHGIVRRQRQALDVELIRRWGHEFAVLTENPGLLRPFEDVFRQL